MKNIENNKSIEEVIVEYTMNLAFLNYVGLSQHEIVMLIVDSGAEKEDINMVLSSLNDMEDEFADKIFEEGKVNFVKSFEKLLRRIKMAQGYGEMGDINMTISKEDFHLEDEGARRIDELGNEETDKEA